MSSSSNNYYESKSFPAAEKVVLAETITFNKIEDIEAKFHMKLMTPTIDTDDISERNYEGYQKTNYLYLTIPAYMLLSFMNPSIEAANGYTHLGNQYFLTFPTNHFTIPRGTEFLAEFVGGDLRIDKLMIVGIYYDYDIEEEE